MPTRAPDVAVIGAGAIGACAAYYLSGEGARVVLIDAGRPGEGCSFGNAGLVVPGFSLPIAGPKAIPKSLRWVTDRYGPVRFRARLTPGFLRWLWHFYRACTRSQALAGATALHRLGKASLECYRQLARDLGPFGYREDGWLHLYESLSALREAQQEAGLLQRLGVQSARLDWTECLELAPGLSPTVIGGVYYLEEAHMHPHQFVSSLVEQLAARGVEIRSNARVHGFKRASGRVVSALLGEGEIEADRYVVSAGAWSGRLLEGLLGWIPIQPAKGHSLTEAEPAIVPRVPLMFGEPHVIATPMTDVVRMTGGLDLVGFNATIEEMRLEAIRRAGARFLEGWKASPPEQAWSGFRPLTPDSLPLIGPVKRASNLILAAGHGQLGMTLAPITGKLVATMVLGGEQSDDVRPVLPERYGL